MVELLEQRLSKVSNEGVEQVRTALSVPHINPRENWQNMPYLKYDLTERIAQAILASRDFAPVLYSAVNKDPLKRVYYGFLSTGKMPDEFLKSLTEWERVYFFAGRWTTRDADLSEPIDVLTVRHLERGLDNLYEGHYVRKARGEYTRQLILPQGKEIREAYKRIISDYEKVQEVQKQNPAQETKKKIIMMPQREQGSLFS